MYNCPFCPQSFTSLRGLSIHRTRTHRNPVEYNCIDCSVELTEDNQLRCDRKRGIRLCRDCKENRTKTWNQENDIHVRQRINKNYADRTQEQIEIDNAQNAKRCREERTQLRSELLDAYGHMCVCCGIAIDEFLCIDHIFHNGSIDFRVHAGSLVFYRYLKKSGWPKDQYRLLCYNCNMSLGRYGYCPHQIQLELFPSQKNRRQYLND